MYAFFSDEIQLQKVCAEKKILVRPPSDGGLMIPPWTFCDVLVKRLVSFFGFLSGKFHEKFVRKIS